MIRDPVNRRRDRSRRCPSRAGVAVALNAAVVVGCAVAYATGVDPEPRQLFSDAVRLFFDARPAESARTFDALVDAAPRLEPGLWQRGLAFYYAERYADGRKQFELHRTVNPDDVENAAWHFLCVARIDGLEAARAAILPVGDDPRVPMKQVLDLYAGRCGPDAVVEAADRGAGETRRNQLCFAHLYVGLYHEAAGDAARAREHVALAAGRFHMDHYMGEVAVVHARLRGWQAAAEPASRPDDRP